MARAQVSYAGLQHASRFHELIIWVFSLAVAIAAGTVLSGQAPREWRDYAGGPDSSRFVASTQITKANVGQLEVAWTYPAGLTDFNPLVVRGPGAGPAVTAGGVFADLLRVCAYLGARL